MGVVGVVMSAGTLVAGGLAGAANATVLRVQVELAACEADTPILLNVAMLPSHKVATMNVCW